MKRLAILILTVLLWQYNVMAQCGEYIESISDSELEPYILDGNVQSFILSEGEVVTANFAFQAGKSYKLDVCGMDMFFKEITITEGKTELFKNFGKGTDDKFVTLEDGTMLPLNGLNFYEFKPDHNMNLKVKIKIVPFDAGSSFKLEGCLGVLVGVKK
ncbi:MAG: hypothetical protein IKR94_08560 [Bacteroidales bacterium]|nr:hypothetical protein [Bacteroidales bacterium]MBR4215357.1 hypothetical protein [Bacteroidales bacterium]